MRNEELYASNFMEALLRAVLLLSDRDGQPCGAIDILSRAGSDPQRGLRVRCRITPEPDAPPPDARIRIVYPEASKQ